MSISAQGTTFTISTATTPATIGGVKSWDGFDGESTEIDNTTLASTAKQKKLGLQDFGNLTLDVFWDDTDAGQAECHAARADGSSHEIVMTLPSGRTGTFDVRVKGTPQNGGVDDEVNGSISMIIDGAVVWTN